MKPVGSGYQVEVILGDVTHKQELTCKELAVHLIGLDSEEPAEASDSFGMQTFSCIGPAERMSDEENRQEKNVGKEGIYTTAGKMMNLTDPANAK